MRPSPPKPPSEIRLHGFAALACLFSIAAVYWPTLQFDFTGFDDTAYVLRHDWVRHGLSTNGLVTAFFSDGGIYWHPLTWISHMLDVSLFGLNAGPQHLQNIVWHVGSAALLYAVARACGLSWLPGLVCALLWALHPLRVESVAWVAGRKDVLSGFFWLLAVRLYLRYAAAPAWQRYLPVLAAALAGYLAKPTMVTLPFFLLLLDWWPLRRPWSPRLLVEKLPFFALSLALSWVTFLSQQQAGALSMVRDLSLADRLQNAAIAYVWYLSKSLWPFDLAILYPYSRTLDPAVWSAAAALLLALSGLVLWLRHRRPALLPAWFGFLGILVPMIGLVQAGPQPYADRFSYIASIPLTLGLVAVLFPREPASPRQAAAANTRGMHPWLAGIAVVLLVALGLRSATQVAVWRDGETVFAHATAVVPDNALAATNLGALRIARGAYSEALAPLESAVRANPRYALAHYNLGLTLTHLDRLREAERALLRATSLNPTQAEAWLALAAAQSRQQENARAIRSFRRALGLSMPAAQRAQAHTDLGLALIRTGQPDPAGEQFRLALDANPNHQPALINRAVFLYRRGDFSEALTLARHALRQNPADTQLQGMVRTLERSSWPSKSQ